MKKSNAKKIKNSEAYHILMYMEDSSPKIKKFKTTDELGKFVDKFNKKHPDYASPDSGYWIDLAVTGVTGEIHFFTDGIEVS